MEEVRGSIPLSSTESRLSKPAFFLLGGRRGAMQLILVHGYLAPAALLWPLGRRLAQHGHTFELFDYPSRLPPFERHAAALADRLRRLEGPVGLIGHSMGGLMIHRALELSPGVEVEAQLFLATPHRGAASVQWLARLPGARRLATGVTPGAFGIDAPTPRGRVGAIAGSRDTMVRPREAALTGPAPFLALPFGHNELVLRSATAQAIARFLACGEFD
jgi:pimeloyl-ACP methyl ester carboxylesterase